MVAASNAAGTKALVPCLGPGDAGGCRRLAREGDGAAGDEPAQCGADGAAGAGTRGDGGLATGAGQRPVGLGADLLAPGQEQGSAHGGPKGLPALQAGAVPPRLGLHAEAGDLPNEARAAFEAARAEQMALQGGAREPTQTAWESACQAAQEPGSR